MSAVRLDFFFFLYIYAVSCWYLPPSYNNDHYVYYRMLLIFSVGCCFFFLLPFSEMAMYMGFLFVCYFLFCLHVGPTMSGTYMSLIIDSDYYAM